MPASATLPSTTFSARAGCAGAGEGGRASRDGDTLSWYRLGVKRLQPRLRVDSVLIFFAFGCGMPALCGSHNMPISLVSPQAVPPTNSYFRFIRFAGLFHGRILSFWRRPTTMPAEIPSRFTKPWISATRRPLSSRSYCCGINLGEYRLIDAFHNRIVAGEKFDWSLDDVEGYLAEADQQLLAERS